jgi:tetratricopeptide (TPR) repeat protein
VSGQNDSAIADLDKAVALKPDDIVNYFRRGEIFYAMGQPERALADFTKAIELSATPETYGMRLIIIARSANTSAQSPTTTRR